MPKELAAASVRVATVLKGEIDVPEDKIITFVTPLLGFNHLRRFFIFQDKPGPMFWLQSIEDGKVALCLLAPFAAGLDPDIAITPADVIDIGAAGADDIDVYTVVVLDRDPMQVRTNLRAPILVGRQSNKVKQVVLDDPKLPIRFYLRDLLRR